MGAERDEPTDSGPIAVESHPVRHGAQDTRGRDSAKYYRNLVVLGVMLVVICAALVIVLGRDGDDRTASSGAAGAGASAAREPRQACIDELTAWLPWVTGPGSPMDAAAEWGMNSEEYRIVLGGWQTFRANLYRVGNDQASAIAYDQVLSGCNAMTHTYIPGHMPPG